MTIDPEAMGGKPCIRGQRVTAGMSGESISAGRTLPDLLADFPYLEEQDIREALKFAASLAQGGEVRLTSGSMRLLIDSNALHGLVGQTACTPVALAIGRNEAHMKSISFDLSFPHRLS